MMIMDNVTPIRGIFLTAQYQYPPEEIHALRKKLKMSNSAFARMFFVTKSTVVKWQTGERKPTGSALRLLQFVEVVAEGKHVDINSRIRSAFTAKYGESKQ